MERVRKKENEYWQKNKKNTSATSIKIIYMILSLKLCIYYFVIHNRFSLDFLSDLPASTYKKDRIRKE